MFEMKKPIAFILLILLVFAVASIVFYLYGLPLLNQPAECHYGGGIKSFGCSTSFGTFMTFLGAGVILAIAVIWNRFGRY